MNWTRRYRTADVVARPERYWPALAVVAWLVGVAGLLWLGPVSGSVHDVVVTTDAMPLAVAQGPSTAVVGYLAVGQTHVYVPVAVPVTLAVGESLAAVGGRWGRALAVAFGLFAAAQLLVLSGCGCGTGTVVPLGEAAVGR